MKKLLFSALALSAMAVNTSTAQLAAGSIAPNFTVTAYQPGLATAGMNSNGTYTLYDYLDAGYSVIMDVSATWCGPCWNYHTGVTGATGGVPAFEGFYAAHGPAGYPGVNAGTTDDAMVIWVEGDGATADATMLDGSGSIGNWINPTGSQEVHFPMANPASTAANQINNDYNIAYFPTVYKICPNRIVTEVGQLTAAGLYTQTSACPAPASAPADAAAISFDSPLVTCGGGAYTPVVTIQNNGTSAMTNATITVMSGASTVSTGTYVGNLATYGVAQVTCTPIAAYAGGTLDVIVTTASDANAANGTTSAVISNAVQAQGQTGTVHLITDRYASETTWEITNAGGTVIASGGPWADLSANGTTTQTVVNANFAANTCYTFTIYDSYGDGIDSGYGVGSYAVKDATGATIASGGDFTDEESKAFKSGVAGIEELSVAGLNVYPNPATSVVNVAFEATNADYTVSLVDLQGRVITSNVYANLADSQSIQLNVEGVASGNYLVKVVTEGAMSVEKVVIK